MILHSVFEQLGSYIVLSAILLSCVAIAEAGMLRWRAQCCVGWVIIYFCCLKGS